LGCHDQQEFNKRCGKGLNKGVKNEAGTCNFDSMIKHMEKKVAFICMSLTADEVIFKNLN